MPDVLKGVISKALTSFIGRVILGLYTLVIVPVMPTLINAVNSFLGYDLTDAQVSAYSKRAIIGIAALASVWLVNNGLFERASVAVAGLVHKSQVELDKEAATNGDDPVVPPGVK